MEETGISHEEIESEVDIDWKLEEGQINSYRLNDQEVKEALTLLEEAKTWVTLNPRQVTQRIRLIGKEGSVLHVIRCKKGLPDTKDIKTPVTSTSTWPSDGSKYWENYINWLILLYQFSLNWLNSIMKYCFLK